MIKTLKILSRCFLAALVLYFTISSHSMTVADSASTNAIYSVNTAHASQALPFLNYSSRRYAANRLVEAPDPPSVDVHPVPAMPLPSQTGVGITRTIAVNHSVSSYRILPLRI